MKVKLLALITIWQRPEIFRVMAQNLKFPDWVDAQVLCVLSPSDKYLAQNTITCTDRKFKFIFWKNNPVGEKRNHGLRAGLQNDWDFYFKIDSDDLIDPDYWDVVQTLIKDKCLFFGMNQYVAYDTESQKQQIVRYKKVIGGGKFIHRSIVERCFRKKGYLYPPTQNSGLDNTSQRTITEVTGIEPKIIDGCYLLDIKSRENINSYRGLKWLPCTPVEYDYILERYGDVRKQLDGVEQRKV